MDCFSIYQINFVYQNHDAIKDVATCPFIILGMEITKDKIENTIFMENWLEYNVINKKYVSIIKIYGNHSINIICQGYKFIVYELTDYEYRKYRENLEI